MSDVMINDNVPIEIKLSIASSCRAIEYWLSKVVFKEETKIENVSFSEKDHFTVRLKRDQ
jgi:hypothetical protein